MSKQASCFRKVSHCIFDMDGLLLDTEKLYTEATNQVLSRYGKTYTWEAKVQVMGLKSEDVPRKMVELFELPITPENYNEEQCAITNELFIHAELMPDTERIYEEAVKQIAQQFGKTYTLDIRLQVMGTTDQRSAQTAIREMKLPLTEDEYLKRYHTICNKLLGDAKLMTGAARLLTHLHEHKVPIALATSSSSPSYNLKTTNHRDLFNLFHHHVCGSSDPDVKQGKPHPDIFLVAASRFPDTPEPAQCLVFEDAPNGVKAAHSAGMQCVMVPDPRVPDELRSLATLVVNSLDEFKPELFGLPAYEINCAC